MSARQMARLRSLLEEKIHEEETVEDDSDEVIDEPKHHVSFSALAFSDDESESEESEESESDSSSYSDEYEEAEEVDEEVEKEKKEVEEMEYLDQIILEVEKEKQNMSFDYKESDDPAFLSLQSVFTINEKMLNDEKESDKKTGVSSHMIGASRFVNDTAKYYNKPCSYICGGFSIMTVDAPFNFDRNSLVHLDNNAVFLTMKQSREYEKADEEYKAGLAMSQEFTDFITEFWRKHPFHILSIYDMCQVMLLYKDIEQALYFIRLCLVRFECSLPPTVKSLSNIRLLYNEECNRLFYDAFKTYIQLCTHKGSFVTALNSSLFLYSMFPQADPKGCLLRITHLALVSKKFNVVRRMAESQLMISTLPLLMLPNWSFDYGYVLYRADEKEKAREQIKESLKFWPQVIRCFSEKAKVALSIPESVKSTSLYLYSSPNDDINHLVTIFTQREVKLWSTNEMWTLLMECFREVVKEVSEEDFNAIQNDLSDNYISLEKSFSNMKEQYDISDNILTVDAKDFTEGIPEVTVNDILRHVHVNQMEERIGEMLNAQRVDNNIPVDHNWLRLFLETINPEINANELNDDDVAALYEQYEEILQQQMNMGDDGGEGEWQQDWDSD